MVFDGFSRPFRHRKNLMIARVTRRPRQKRIVILGGGFGGVYVAVYLEKLFSSRELKEIEIVLVNRENYIVPTAAAGGHLRLRRT
jgi:hypothetical protein